MALCQDSAPTLISKSPGDQKTLLRWSPSNSPQLLRGNRAPPTPESPPTSSEHSLLWAHPPPWAPLTHPQLRVPMSLPMTLSSSSAWFWLLNTPKATSGSVGMGLVGQTFFFQTVTFGASAQYGADWLLPQEEETGPSRVTRSRTYHHLGSGEIWPLREVANGAGTEYMCPIL